MVYICCTGVQVPWRAETVYPVHGLLPTRLGRSNSCDRRRVTGEVGQRSKSPAGSLPVSVRIPCVIRAGRVRSVRCGSVQCGSDQHRIYAIGKARMRCTPSLGRLPRSDSSVVCLVDAVPVHVQSCFPSTETIRLVRDGEPRTATWTFPRLLSSAVLQVSLAFRPERP